MAEHNADEHENWRDASPGGILSSESDPRRVEAAMNASPSFQRFGLRVRLNPEVGVRPAGAAQTDTSLVLVELPDIQPYHRGGTTINSVNGGIIALVCDLAMGLTIIGLGLPIRTGSGVARLNIRMRRPVEGDSLSATANIQEIRRNLIYSRVEIRNEQGVVCVEATGTVYRSRDAVPD